MSRWALIAVVCCAAACPASAQGVWTAMTAPAESNFTDVWMLPEGTAWAVGQGGTIVRYDGSAWVAETTPVTEDLNAVFALSDSEVWVAGNAGSIYAYDGSAWTRAEGIDANYSIYDLTLDPAGVLWACGSEFLSGGIVLRMQTPGEWQLFAQRPAGLRSMSIPRSGEIWGVGGGDMIHHYSRNAWQNMTTGTGATLFGVHAMADGTVWVTGSNFDDGRQYIFRYAGTEWEQTHAWWGEWLLDIQMFASSGFVVGQEGMVKRWDGAEWTDMGPITQRTLNALSMNGPYHGIAVGDRGVMFEFTQPWINVATSQSMYRAGDAFSLDVTLANPGPALDVDLYVVLDVFGAYFFYPGWTEAADFDNRALAAKSNVTDALLEFQWPAGAGAATGITFWAALLNAGTMTLATNFDFTTFGFM